MQEKGGLDLVRFNSLWKSNVSPEELEVKDIVNVLFPRDQDAFNEFKGQKARKILSDTLKGFDEDEYYEIKDYSDPVFSDDIFGIFTSQDNFETRMLTLDEIMVDIECDRELHVPDFTKGDDFVSLVSSRIKIDNLIDAAQESDRSD